ncbi:MAG: NAD-dependent succinate-semialdehyde dehydrogenase [Balneolaceae bacterium]|nr:NAD-dependent succinate-semialdehyde dehydrogenase [Balneolaceae bacterium]
MKTINPATDELIEEYEPMSSTEIDTILGEAADAQNDWKRKPFSERADILIKAAEMLKRNSGEYSRLMATEMGKPLAQGVSEAEKCGWVCEYYAEHAEKFLQDEPLESDAAKSYVTFNPLGTVLAIMPWNFPFWQVFRFGAPALMAGNAIVLKHAPNVTGCALEIEKLLHEAGLPKPLFRTVIADIDQTQKMIEHQGINAVTLTGSVRAGRAVAAQAGGEIKKTVLELGGSDPYLILEDADVKKSAEICVESRLINSGQSCIAAKRFIVVQNHYDEFLDRVVQLMSDRIYGDPFDEKTDIGPMARSDLRDKLHKQVKDSVEQGARAVLGGSVPEGKGAFYPPTVLTDVDKGMAAYEEELFGPVATVINVRDEEEAIRVANDSDFGLGAAVFSEDRERAERIASDKLQAGCCFVNDFVRSDPRLPFGGVKRSGYGRELSKFGIREFVNIKTVYVA